MKSITSVITSFFCGLLYAFLALIISKPRKRLFVLATLHRELSKRGTVHKESISTLNQTLHLAENEKMLILPDPIYDMVWDSDKIDTIVSELPPSYDGNICLLYKDATRVSEEILPLTPRWLWYDTLDNMRNDIIGLFYCQPLKNA